MQISLEEEVRRYFRRHKIPYADHSRGEDRFNRLDFAFGALAEKRYFSFDAKEKRQRYRLEQWPETGIAEQDLLILDDLAARKVLAFAPNAGLVVRDNLSGPAYYFFTVVDLYLMPKLRVNRRIGEQALLKGKWLIDLRNGQRCSDIEDVFPLIEAYLEQREAIFSKTLACFGDYVGEMIGEGGIQRRAGHWRVDVRETR